MAKATKTSANRPRRAMVVLGMHRSGTSALTGLIETAGARTPANQIAPGAQNPRGFFEATAVARLNDDVMAALGVVWSDTKPLSGDLSDEMYESLSKRARDIIEQEFGGADIIAIKDPRICRLVPFWRRVLTDMGFDISVAFISRAPEEVASSLATRNKLERWQGLDLWLRYNLEAEKHTRDLPRQFIRYDELLSDGESIVAKLRVLGLQHASAEGWADSVDAALRNQKSGEVPLLPAAVETIDDALSEWAAQGEVSAHHDIFDAISEAGARDGHGWLRMSDTESAFAKIKEQTSELAKLALLLVEAQKENEALTKTSKALQTELDELYTELNELSVIAAREEATAKENKELHALVAKVENKRAHSAREAEELHALVAQVEGRRAEAARQNEELHALVAKVEGLRAQASADASGAMDAIEVMRKSTSWRLTAPIRVVKRLLRPD